MVLRISCLLDFKELNDMSHWIWLDLTVNSVSSIDTNKVVPIDEVEVIVELEINVANINLS